MGSNVCIPSENKQDAEEPTIERSLTVSFLTDFQLSVDSLLPTKILLALQLQTLKQMKHEHVPKHQSPQ